MRPRSHFSFPPFLRRRNRFIPIGCLTELGKTMGAFRVSDGLAGYNGVSLKQFTPDPNAAAVHRVEWPGFWPGHPPTPPDMRFSASGG